MMNEDVTVDRLGPGASESGRRVRCQANEEAGKTDAAHTILSGILRCSQ